MCPTLFTLGPLSIPLLGEVGPFSLPTYGVLVASGFLVGLYLLARLAKRHGFDADKMTNLGVYVALAAIVGAKLFMMLVDMDVYLRDPGRLFSLSALQAGGIFYGGLLAAMATAFWYARREGLPGLATADLFAPAVAIGHSRRPLGLLRGGLLLGQADRCPLGTGLHRPECPPIGGRAAQRSLAPDPALRGGGRACGRSHPLAAARTPSPARNRARLVPDAVFHLPAVRRVLPGRFCPRLPLRRTSQHNAVACGFADSRRRLSRLRPTRRAGGSTRLTFTMKRRGMACCALYTPGADLPGNARDALSLAATAATKAAQKE